jgi:hypothetical protein
MAFGVLVVGGILQSVETRAQTRAKGPWWPSPHGAGDQAGATNYITPEKVVKAMRLVKTGQMYELGHIYEASMPQYGNRAYYLNVTPAPRPRQESDRVAHQDYFTGYLGQMGTQFDALGHQGHAVKMADGSLQFVYYNGFTMVGADSCCVQAQPAVTEEPLSVHHELFFKEGIYLLENMDLRELARDRVYEFLFVCTTLPVKGATGSPVRPIAIR